MLTLGGAVDNFGPLCCPPMPKEEKRRLLGASPPPARGLRPPRIAKAILPPGIPMMSRLRRHAFVCLGYAAPIAPLPPAILALRSEEHTSELQSLMRSSSAGFCLQKK